MFLRNEWYVSALSSELREKPVARRLLGEPVVLYRTASGHAVALEDRCPHRGAPISTGSVTGERIACGYHGFEFEASGRCAHMPGFERVPPQVCVRSYPVIERWNWVFVWMGDLAQAHESRLPDFRWMTESGWTGGSDYLHVRASYLLVRDNLLDLTHARYVHRNTLATSAVTDHPLNVEVEDRHVRLSRMMPNIDPSPFFRRLGGFTGRVDHSQKIFFEPPCYVIVDTRVAPVAGGEDKPAAEVRVLNALVPERDGSTHYFWGIVRNFAPDDAALTDLQMDMNRRTFDEDVAVLEQQQDRLDTAPDGWRAMPTAHDGGCIQAERMINRMLAVERGAA